MFLTQFYFFEWGMLKFPIRIISEFMLSSFYFSYTLTPCIRVLHNPSHPAGQENLPLYGTWRFTIVVKEIHFWPLSWARRIKFRVLRCFFYTHFNIILPSMLTHPKWRLISFTISMFRRQLSSRTGMVLLESCLQTYMTHTIVEFTVNKLLMMDRETFPNM